MSFPIILKQNLYPTSLPQHITALSVSSNLPDIDKFNKHPDSPQPDDLPLQQQSANFFLRWVKGEASSQTRWFFHTKSRVVFLLIASRLPQAGNMQGNSKAIKCFLHCTGEAAVNFMWLSQSNPRTLVKENTHSIYCVNHQPYHQHCAAVITCWGKKNLKKKRDTTETSSS